MSGRMVFRMFLDSNFVCIFPIDELDSGTIWIWRAPYNGGLGAVIPAGFPETDSLTLSGLLRTVKP